MAFAGSARLFVRLVVKEDMKDKIVKILINASIGVLTSLASLYLGAGAVETVAVSGTVTGAVGGRVGDMLSAVFA